VDQVTREVLQARASRHCWSPLWRLVKISRCRECRLRWPCLAHLDAVRALQTVAPSPPAWASEPTELLPVVTLAQRHRGYTALGQQRPG
jgi:hypothetical protein